MKKDYTFNNAGMVTGIEYLDNGSTQKENYTYQYNALGQITTETLYSHYLIDDDGTDKNTITDITKDFTYYPVGSLHTEAEHKEETIDGHKTTKNTTTTYTYDLTGNRKTTNDGTDNFTYQYDPYGRLSSVKKGTQDYQSYTYDAQGRTKAETTYWYAGSTKKKGTVKNYNYYASGQLGNIETLYYNYDQIIESDANDYYYYDGNGQRVRKVTTGGVTKYYYTGSSVLVTLDESNNKTSENIISVGGDIIAGKRFEGMYTDKWYFYDYDLRGSVTSILDPDGVYTSGYQYDAFGNATRKGDSDFKNEMAFTGCIADKSSGLYYMNSRYYNPSTGRFLTQDAAGGDAWTNNLYTYCGNNPVSFIDPTGYRLVIAEDEHGRPITAPPSQPSSGDPTSGKSGGEEDKEKEFKAIQDHLYFGKYFTGTLDDYAYDLIDLYKGVSLASFSKTTKSIVAGSTYVTSQTAYALVGERQDLIDYADTFDTTAIAAVNAGADVAGPPILKGLAKSYPIIKKIVTALSAGEAVALLGVPAVFIAGSQAQHDMISQQIEKTGGDGRLVIPILAEFSGGGGFHGGAWTMNPNGILEGRAR